MKKYLVTLIFLVMLCLIGLSSHQALAVVEFIPGRNDLKPEEEASKQNTMDANSNRKSINGSAPISDSSDIESSQHNERLADANGARSNGNPFIPSSDMRGMMPAQGGNSMMQRSNIMAKDNASSFQKQVDESYRVGQTNYQTVRSTVIADATIMRGMGLMARESSTALGAVGGRAAPAETSSYIGEDGEGSGQTQSNGQSDMYSLALYAGIMYNLYNTLNPAGDELGRINGKRYSKWLQKITPETVMNGKPEVFAWVDGAGRVHLVMAMLEDASPNNWSDNEAQDDAPTAMQKGNEVIAKNQMAKGLHQSATGGHSKSVALDAAGEEIPAMGAYSGANAKTDAGDDAITDGQRKSEDASRGQRNDRTKSNSTSQSGKKEMFRSQQDVRHSRQTYAMSFQFHMGSPVKGMRGQIDEMTAYPPQIAICRTSFRGMGDIEQGQARFEASSGL